MRDQTARSHLPFFANLSHVTFCGANPTERERGPPGGLFNRRTTQYDPVKVMKSFWAVRTKEASAALMRGDADSQIGRLVPDDP
jgi:hypothetical protein